MSDENTMLTTTGDGIVQNQVIGHLQVMQAGILINMFQSPYLYI